VEALFINILRGWISPEGSQTEPEEERKVLKKGATWAVERGFGSSQDLEHIEEQGCIKGADPDRVSDRAIERGRAQLGTVGSGNHFVEVGYVAEVFDEEAARTLGLWKDQVTILVHTGSEVWDIRCAMITSGDVGCRQEVPD
jgi:tRNA-splicing ligase RtcB